MKVPFRQQASDYDCVPTTFINALNHLFIRAEIPPFIVHRIYKDCLDIEASRGTSRRAIQEVGHLLNHYRDIRYGKFALESQFLWGTQVHFKQHSKIIRCINSNGAALLCVHSSRNNWHYILAFHYEDRWLYCYDPSPRTKRFLDNGAVQFDLSAGQQEANLRIHCEWLEKSFNNAKHSNDRKYTLGDIDDRECLLLNRISL